MRDPQINSKGSTNLFFGIFLYSKSSVWLDIKTKRDEIKGVEHKGVFCQTHPLPKTN